MRAARSSNEKPPPGARPLRSERHRAPLLWLLLPFAAGIASEQMLPAPPPVGALLAGASVCALAGVAAVFVLQRHAAGLGAVVLALFLAGAANYEIHRARLPGWDNLPARETTVTLRIDSLARQNPAARTRPVISGMGRVVAGGEELGGLDGQPVYFSLAPPGGGVDAAQIIRTAEIRVSGILEALPRNAGADSFEGSLVSAGMNFRLSGGRVLGVGRAPSAAAVFFDRLRGRFSATLGLGLEARPREAGIFRAMALGQKQEVDSEQRAIFLGSGTMHLFAISGIHIIVIATGIYFLLLVLRLPRWPRYLAGMAALWIYVQVTGASPSAVRAFVMVAILQTAMMTRLPVNGIATLALAALVVLVAGPMQLFSASFQMSYGIVAAILLYGLPLGEAWNARWELFVDVPKVAWTRMQRGLSVAHRYFLGVLAISFSAGLVSTLCGVVYFKLVTPGALLANMALIPAASLVILAGFLSIVCGLAGLGPMCVVFNRAAALILAVMQRLLALAVRVPGSSHAAHFEPQWAGMAALAGLLAAMCYGYSQKWALRRGGFWAPVAIVAVVLAVLVGYD